MAPEPFPALTPPARSRADRILRYLHTTDASDYWPLICALPEFDAAASERARGCGFPAWFALSSGELIVRDGVLAQWVVLDQQQWAAEHPDRRGLLPQFSGDTKR